MPFFSDFQMCIWAAPKYTLALYHKSLSVRVIPLLMRCPVTRCIPPALIHQVADG